MISSRSSLPTIRSAQLPNSAPSSGQISRHSFPSSRRGLRDDGRRERGVLEDVDSYVAFVDPSGGQRDSMTLAIAHRDGDRAVLDCSANGGRRSRPRTWSTEFADTLKPTACPACMVIGTPASGRARPSAGMESSTCPPRNRRATSIGTAAEDQFGRGRAARQRPADQTTRLPRAPDITRRAGQHRPSAWCP